MPRRFRDCAALVCLSLVAVAPAACFRLGSSEDKPLSQYNLILINIDSLRADHLGTYGYGRDTSPFIDELAAEGIVFERAFSNSSYTRESVASLLSGRLPSVAGSTGWYATLSEEARSLSESFRASGCETGFFSNTIMLRDPGFTQGFDEVQHLPERWGISGAGLRLSKRALAFVADRGGRRFMMYLHYLDPHGPYDPAAEHYLRFAPQVSASPLRLYTDLRPRLPALVRDGVRPGEPRFEDLIRRYDAEIFDTDRAVEALFRGLEELDLLDGTLVVITADHGEEFLEHGFVEHAWTLYRESLHVPLILWAPLAFGPSRIDAPVSGIDIAPTLLHLMEVPYDGSDLDGTPLLRRSGDELRFVAPGRPFIGELLIEERNVLRTVIEGDWKYIAAQRWLRPEARPGAIEAEQRLRDAATRRAIPWGPIVREELYRLSDDPGETRDLSGDFPEKLQELRRLLELYRLRSASEAVGPARPRAPLPAEKERLRALGYL